MDINGVNSKLNPMSDSVNTNSQTPKQDAQKVEENPQGKKDKLELSHEARALQSKKIEPKDLDAIRNRIDSGFYNKPEVIDKVANSLLKEIGGQL